MCVIVGLVAAIVLAVPLSVVIFLARCGSEGGVCDFGAAWVSAKAFMFTVLPALGAIGGLVWALSEIDDEAKRERAKLEAEELARQAAERQRREDLDRRLARLAKLRSEAQSAALSLASVAADAELDLDMAERELLEGRYSPFWEAMEEGTDKLNRFDQTVALIAARRTEYADGNAKIGMNAPAFDLAISMLPDPTDTHRRLVAMYRRAQTDPHFANIYEQRRIAARLDRTNAILVAGFSSLGQAIERLGDRTEDAIRDLGAKLDCRLGSIQSSLESAAAAAAEQREALATELRRCGDRTDAVTEQLRQDVANRTEHERVSRRMLDNIQHRRTPKFGETPLS
jgi:hypothetical protein